MPSVFIIMSLCLQVNPDESAKTLDDRRETRLVAIQSRHALAGSYPADASKLDALADVRVGVDASLHGLPRPSGALNVGGNWRRKPGTCFLEERCRTEMGRYRTSLGLKLHRQRTEWKPRPGGHARAVSTVASEGLFAWGFENRNEWNHDRGDVHDYAERHCGQPNTDVDTAAHDDGLAAAKGRMGSHCAQRDPVTPRSESAANPGLGASFGRGNDRGLRKDRGLRRLLLKWYGANRRDLPWRRTRDPYAIWVSEIMLQQTRVAAVLGHYREFLERFPDIEALAEAAEDAVLAVWSGLGYYRRARMLHQCAREVVERYGGSLPQQAAALRTLPGIGRYTAAAIASIAFQEPVAVVDGNVERVLGRLAGCDLSQKQAWERAQELVAPSQPGDFNQAIMELGATICLPREPRCPACPVRRWCKAKGEITRAKPVSRQQRKQIWCSLERRDGQVRLAQRQKTASLMAGMWELPQWTKPPRASATKASWRTFRHSITDTDYTVHVLRDWARTGPGKIKGGRWIAIQEIAALPITGLTRKILKADGLI